MDFRPTPAQQDLGPLTRAILDDHVTADRLREIETKGEEFDRALWMQLAGAGVLAAALPPAAGGDGFGLLEQCSVLVELGRAVAPVPYLSSIVTAAAGVAAFGDATQLDRWAAPAGRGELVLTAALADEGVVHAERSGAGWVLTGSKPVVPAGPYADVLVVPATIGDGTSAVFLVEAGDDGVTVLPQQVAGAQGAGWLELAGVRLAADRLLGDLVAGPEIVGWLRAHATVGSCAAQLGILERALELTARYARTRVQFGRAIGTFQAVTQRLADAYVDVEAVRLTLWQAAWLLGEGLPGGIEVATAKFWAADAGHRVAHTMVHVHGGVGIDLDHPVHRYFLAAKHHEFTLGGATAQLREIGAALAGADG